MLDFLRIVYESLRPVNLPLTMLVGAIVLYWILVLFGLLDLDLFDGDGIGLDIGGDDGGGFGDGDGDDGGGIFRPITQFLAMGEVPTTVVLSIMIVAMWFGSIILNHYFNEGFFWKAALLMVPNIVGAVVATHIITLPMRKLVKKFNKGEAETKSFVGQECTILSLEANASHGQAQVATSGAPLVINVRTSENELLRKGDIATITKENRASGIFTITKATNPIPQEKIC
jgi:hypothetical protein